MAVARSPVVDPIYYAVMRLRLQTRRWKHVDVKQHLLQLSLFRKTLHAFLVVHKPRKFVVGPSHALLGSPWIQT